ncbi:MAG: hypothetical protein FWB86_01475 [Treponema sp.]|nr:hypothetical protein [Treponema sp.]MCL2250346.1 hypothetical protein [Treponema sp.]
MVKMNHKKILPLLLTVFILSFSNTWAQEEPVNEEKNQLPRQFRQIVLGMSLDELKTNLMADSYFYFRGDRDVSFLPAREQSLVETTGTYFIKRAFFQLRDGQLFIMAFTLNTEVIDHYSIFMQFVDKYGQPSYLDPRSAVWETEETRISIERPLTVKYIDKIVFDDIINESGVAESGQVKLRQDFIDEF